MPLTKPMGEHLAALIHQLRPEWDVLGCLKALEKVAGRNEFDVTMAAIRAAADLGAKTPGVIPSDGPHWRERLSEVRVPRNPLPHEECAKHAGQFRLSCSNCRSEKLAPVVELHPQEPSQETLAWREALAAARARCCSHGVEHDHCTEAHDQEEADE